MDLYMTSRELAQRWRISSQTLANWRHDGKGPPYIRIAGKVLYPYEGVQAWEKLAPGWLPSEDSIQSQPQST